MNKVHHWLCAALTAVLASCGDDRGANDESDGTFLPFASDFDGFHEWDSVPAASKDAPFDPLHASLGPATVYINKRPVKGAVTFEPGTLIVKETNDGPLADRTIFAMAKRGGKYNVTGAVGWEWFELKNVANGGVTINWRGLGPPDGSSYGGDPNSECNGCHGEAEDHDYVWTDGLRLPER